MPRIYIDRSPDGRFLARISLRCQDCNEWLEFFGLPTGEDPNGARVSKDKRTVHLAIGTQETLAEYYTKAIANMAIPKKETVAAVPVKPVKPTIKVFKAA